MKLFEIESNTYPIYILIHIRYIEQEEEGEEEYSGADNEMLASVKVHGVNDDQYMHLQNLFEQEDDIMQELADEIANNVVDIPGTFQGAEIVDIRTDPNFDASNEITPASRDVTVDWLVTMAPGLVEIPAFHNLGVKFDFQPGTGFVGRHRSDQPTDDEPAPPIDKKLH